MSISRLLLISRDDILNSSTGTSGRRLYRRLARLTHLGFQFVVTAPQPDTWCSLATEPDHTLAGASTIHERLVDAGGELDGIYYVARSSLTQRRNRQEALHDMLTRYATSPGNCYLFSSSKKFVLAARELEINATMLSADRPLMKELRALRKQLFDSEKDTA